MAEAPLASDLKARLRTGGRVIGSWLAIPSTVTADIMASSGFDFLVIDLEHAPISIETAAEMIRVIDRCGCSPLVRVPELNEAFIKCLLDSGAHGVIIPNIKTADEAARAVAACRYPPAGIRGVGMHRAHGYGSSFTEYFEAANEAIMVVAQIESGSAIEQIDDIASVEGIDAVLIGPYDLSADLGCPGDFKHPSFMAAVRQFDAVSARVQIATGMHVVEPDPAGLKASMARGHRFLVYGVDMRMLDVSARIGSRILDDLT